MGFKRPGWPDSPYKGLGFYTEEDAPLFAGRDEDVVMGARALADWNNRLLLLHGSTGCGKSSFLRAGLIPYLERRGAGMAFARDGDTAASRILSIISTAEPLSKLASAIYTFCDRAPIVQTPAGPEILNLRKALPDLDEHDLGAFLRNYANSPDILSVLERLSGLMPKTLVLIIDQGEQVLTVDTSDRGDLAREQFFEFLSNFLDAQFDIKLLIALRTEYLGRFAARLRRGLRGPGVTYLFLNELSDGQIKEAIARPTSRQNFNSLGSPYDHYGFSFESGVIDAIIEQLSGVSGSKLPAVQILCTALYERVEGRVGNRTVSFGDLAEVGGVEGSLGEFLDNRLFACGTNAGLAPVVCAAEVDRWKGILHRLARLQPDGTVTTDLLPETVLIEHLQGTRLNIISTLQTLLAVQLLRDVNVIEKTTGRVVRCFALGHDTLGLVLHNWKFRHDQQTPFAPVRFDEDDTDEEHYVPGRDIALCLSGGGYRSILFSVGAIWRLNELGLLPLIGRVSAVSGGAVVAALLGAQWSRLDFGPDGVARNFRASLVEPLRQFVGRTSESMWSIFFSMLLPRLGSQQNLKMTNRLDLLYANATLQDLPNEPVVVFSATNLQTGSLFRFSKSYLGDYLLGKVRRPDLRLSRVVAASGSFPSMSRPITLKFRSQEWDASQSRQPDAFREEIDLGDGMLANHLGLEGAWKQHQTILVCDGATKMEPKAKTDTPSALLGIVRVVNVLGLQLHDLFERQIREAFASGQKRGAYWSIRSQIADYGLNDCVPVDQSRATELSQVPPRFIKMDLSMQERLINWGYAICDAAIRKQLGAREGTAPKFPYERGV
jgi:NTE family protein